MQWERFWPQSRRGEERVQKIIQSGFVWYELCSAKSHIGAPIILTKFFEAMDGYDKMDTKLQDKFLEHSFSQFLAYLYLDNANKAKNRSILTRLNTQQLHGND